MNLTNGVSSSGITDFMLVKSPNERGDNLDEAGTEDHFVGNEFKTPHLLDSGTRAALYAGICGLYERAYFAGCGTYFRGEGDLPGSTEEDNNIWDREEFGHTSKLHFDFSKDNILEVGVPGEDGVVNREFSGLRLMQKNTISRFINAFLGDPYSFVSRRPSWGNLPEVEWSTDQIVQATWDPEGETQGWFPSLFGEYFFLRLRHLFFTFAGAKYDGVMGGHYRESCEKLKDFVSAAWLGEEANDPDRNLAKYYAEELIKGVSVADLIKSRFEGVEPHKYVISNRLTRSGFESYSALLSLYNRLYYSSEMTFKYPEEPWAYRFIADGLIVKGHVVIDLDYTPDSGLTVRDDVTTKDIIVDELKYEKEARARLAYINPNPASEDGVVASYTESGSFRPEAIISSENNTIRSSFNLEDFKDKFSAYIENKYPNFKIHQIRGVLSVGNHTIQHDNSADFDYTFTLLDDEGNEFEDVFVYVASFGEFSRSIRCNVDWGGSLWYDVHIPKYHDEYNVTASGELRDEEVSYIDCLTHPGAEAYASGRIKSSKAHCLLAVREQHFTSDDPDAEKWDISWYNLIADDIALSFPWVGFASFSSAAPAALYKRIRERLEEFLGFDPNGEPRLGVKYSPFSEERMENCFQSKFGIESINVELSSVAVMCGSFVSKDEYGGEILVDPPMDGEIPDFFIDMDVDPDREISDVSISVIHNEQRLPLNNIPIALERRFLFGNVKVAPRYGDGWYERLGDWVITGKIGRVVRFCTDFKFKCLQCD